MSYHPNYGTLGKKISSLIQRFNNEMKYDAPKMSGQITSQEWMQSLNEHNQRVFNKYQRGAILLKDEYIQTKNSIDKKTQSILYPLSNSFDEAKRHTGLLQRNLVVSQMSSGNLNEAALLKQIDDDFRNNYIDANGERLLYLTTHDISNIGTKIKAIAKLNEGFAALGMNEVKDIQTDIETAAGEFAELQSTFGV
jgi:hypothetical protein